MNRMAWRPRISTLTNCELHLQKVRPCVVAPEFRFAMNTHIPTDEVDDEKRVYTVAGFLILSFAFVIQFAFGVPSAESVERLPPTIKSVYHATGKLGLTGAMAALGLTLIIVDLVIQARRERAVAKRAAERKKAAQAAKAAEQKLDTGEPISDQGQSPTAEGEQRASGNPNESQPRGQQWEAGVVELETAKYFTKDGKRVRKGRKDSSDVTSRNSGRPDNWK